MKGFSQKSRSIWPEQFQADHNSMINPFPVSCFLVLLHCQLHLWKPKGAWVTHRRRKGLRWMGGCHSTCQVKADMCETCQHVTWWSPRHVLIDWCHLLGMLPWFQRGVKTWALADWKKEILFVRKMSLAYDEHYAVIQNVNCAALCAFQL